MVLHKKVAFQHTSDGSEGSSSRPFGPHHRLSASSSAETVLHHPQTQKENARPTSSSTIYRTNTDESFLPRTVIGGPSGIPQVLGFTSRNTSATDFDASITQEANWPLPDSLAQVLSYQAKHYAPPKPKESSFAQQAQVQNRVFDPDHGPIYSHCTECDPSGGPTVRRDS